MQAKHKPLKQKLIALLTVAVIFAAAFSYFSFPSFGGNAEAATTAPYQKEALEISNSEFEQTSGTAPYEPSGWTASVLGNTAEGATIGGVVDLSPSTFNNSTALKDYKLDSYDEFKNGKFPQTPFGKNVSESSSQLYFPGTNSNALMINSGGSNAAYGYKSSTVSLSSNSHYKISAWVKTGDFDNHGASIMVDGLKNPLIFRDINTTSQLGGTDANQDKNKNYGWVEYTFFIETSTMIDSSVSISLQLGDAYTYTDKYGNTHSELHTAKGYAFFDHITAFRLAPDEFRKNITGITNESSFLYPDNENRTYALSADETRMYYSENDAEYLCIDNGELVGSDDANFEDKEIGSFDNGGSAWSAAEESAGSFRYGIFNFTDDDLGISSSEPYSPNGSDDRIALVSSYNKDRNEKFEQRNTGIVSPFFNVKRFVNYRLSLWVKTENGMVASAAIVGYDYRGGVNTPGNNYGKPQLRRATELTEGDSTNTSRNGWREIAFYIQGSQFADYSIQLELRLGRRSVDNNGDVTSEDAAGVAMFDNIRIEQITSTEYANYSGNGTTVTFDDTSATYTISNGGFNNIEAYDEYAEPFAPANWTLMGAGEDGTTGMSTNQVNDDYANYVVSGVIASNATSYKQKEMGGGAYVEKPVNTHKTTDASGVPTNLLMIKSDESTGLPADQKEKGGVAVGYRSSSFTISANTVQRIDVELFADDISGYGANLVLKNGTNVIASIEKIKTTNNVYKTYSFYVQTGSNSLNEVCVEIWLGLYDRNNNTDKLAYGTLFVEEVELTDMSAASGEDESAATAALESARSAFSERANTYKTKRPGADTDFAVYSSLSEDFSAFDYYDSNTVRRPYSWSVNSVQSHSNGNEALNFGIFDTRDSVPSGYSHKGADNQYVMIVQNTAPASSRVRSNISYNLASGSYYTITVVAKVDIPLATEGSIQPSGYKGAYIGLADSEFAMSDIKNTKTVSDIYIPDSDSENEYKTFTFYIRTAGELATDDDDSSSSSNTSDTVVTMEFGIGGTSVNEWALGTMYINSVTVTQSDNVAFEEAQASLENGGVLQGKYNAIADYGDEEEEEDEEEEDNSSSVTGDNWYVYTSVILVVVIIVVLISVLVRYYGIKRKRDSVGKGGVSYDREKTLVRQHNRRVEEAAMITDKNLDSYDAFDEFEEDKIEEEQLRRQEAEELALIEKADEETEVSPAESDISEQPVIESETEVKEETETTVAEAKAGAETADAEETEETDEGYTYTDEIVDFTPSVEKRRELEAKKAEEARLKAEKEAAAKKAAEEKAKAEAERKAAERRYNNWDSFDD